MSFDGKHIDLLEGKDMFCHSEEGDAIGNVVLGS